LEYYGQQPNPEEGDNSGTSEYVYRPTAACQPARCERLCTILPGKQAQYATPSNQPLSKGEFWRESARASDSIPFVATWNVSNLPADLTRCRMQFDGNAELSYEIMMTSSELVGFLIDVIHFKRARIIDFPRDFTVNCYI